MRSNKYPIFFKITILIIIFSVFLIGFLKVSKYKYYSNNANHSLDNYSIRLDTSDINSTLQLEYSSTFNLTTIRTGDFDNDGFCDIFLNQEESMPVIKIFKGSGDDYDLWQNLSFTENIQDYKIGDIDGDTYLDIISYWYSGAGNLDIYLQNNQTNSYAIIPNGTEITGSFSVSVLDFGNIFLSDRLDIIYSWDTLNSMFWNSSTERLEPMDSLNLFIETIVQIYPKMMVIDDIDGLSKDEIIIYGNDISGDTYFLPIKKNRTSDTFNSSIEYTNISTAPLYMDMILLDMNNDVYKDILVVNSSGLYIYYQNSNMTFPTNYIDSISYNNLFKVVQGNLNDNIIPDILVSDGQDLIIYHDKAIYETPKILTPGLNKIIDIAIADLNNDNIDEIIITGQMGTEFQLLIYYNTLETEIGEDNILNEQSDNFIVGAAAGGGLAGVSLAGSILSPPSAPTPAGMDMSKVAPSSSGEGAGTDPLKFAKSSQDRNVDIGYKKPGKWYKKKKFKMYSSCLGIGIGLSILFLFVFYPLALSSTWIVLLGSILGPIGFFYGIYNFIYNGFYENKGNLYKAYYKGKTKFFWDVFSWAKPILSFYCIYTTINMFLTLTFNDLFSVVTIFGLIIGAFVGLFLLSIYIFKVNKLIEVGDLKQKSLEYLKEKKKSKK